MPAPRAGEIRDVTLVDGRSIFEIIEEARVVGGHGGREFTLVGPHKVVGRHGIAVAPLHARAEVERIHIPGGVRLIAFGQPGHYLIIWVKFHQPGKQQILPTAVEVAVEIHARGLMRNGPAQDLHWGQLRAWGDVTARLGWWAEAVEPADRRRAQQATEHLEHAAPSDANGR